MRLIDADKFEVVGSKVPEGYDVDSYLAGNNEILEMIDNAHTVDAVPVIHGQWIDGVCSNCKFDALYLEYECVQVYSNFCPNCGAKMDLEA